MTVQSQTFNFTPASLEDHEQVNGPIKSKKKIALIGPAIDRLAKHVRWGSRLSSSFYRTVGLNISLRTVTTKTKSSEVDMDFVIWQLSPNLNPSLLKSLMRGASGLIVAVGKSDKTAQKDVEDSTSKSTNSRTANTQAAGHFYVDENISSDTALNAKEADMFDIEQLDNSAKQLKLPIAFIHFADNIAESNVAGSNVAEPNAAESELIVEKLADSNQNSESTSQTLYQNQSKNGIVKLHETDHSLHLELNSEENSEYCLDQAFDYIAGYFANAA